MLLQGVCQLQVNRWDCREGLAKLVLNQGVGFVFQVNKLTLTKKPPLLTGAVQSFGHKIDRVF